MASRTNWLSERPDDDGCDCCMVAGTIEYGTYVALFGNPGHLTRYRAATRDRRTQAIL